MVALEQSLNEIVRRHEALRTTFAIVDGRPGAGYRTDLDDDAAGQWTCGSCRRPSGRPKSSGWPPKRPAALRLGPRPALAGHRGAAGRGGARRASDDAPYCFRWLVNRNTDSRDGSHSTTLSAPEGPRRCLSCLFNMRTSPTGSGSGCRVKFWKPSLPIGNSNWRAPPLSGVAYAITPGRRCRLFGVRTNRCCCRGTCSDGLKGAESPGRALPCS